MRQISDKINKIKIWIECNTHLDFTNKKFREYYKILLFLILKKNLIKKRRKKNGKCNNSGFRKVSKN